MYIHVCLCLMSILQQYEFEKVQIPENQEGKVELSKKLSPYGVSLTQYARALNQPEIKS